jgi:hypothetical protein
MKKLIILLCIMSLFRFAHAQSPYFHWVAGFGGSAVDIAIHSTVDEAGNVYSIGSFKGTVDFDPGPSVFNITSQGTSDYPNSFITKLDATGNLIWARAFLGTNSIYGNSIKIGASGNIYTTGHYEGPSDFDPGSGVFSLTPSSGISTFLTKLDSAGNFIWAISSGGLRCYTVALDDQENIYTGGDFFGTVDVDPGPGVTNIYSSQASTYILKLNSLGQFIWVETFGTINYGCPIHEIQIDSDYNVISTGYFANTGDFDPGSGTASLTNFGSQDGYVLKLDANGDFLWVKQIGGVNLDRINSVTLDSLQNVYVTGDFAGTADFDPGAGTDFATSAGHSDIFLVKLDPNGNFLWKNILGGSYIEHGYGVTVDNKQNVYVTGSFSGTIDCDPGSGVYNISSNGSEDILLGIYNSNGDLLSANGFGSSSIDKGRAVYVTDDQDIYLSGNFANSTDFDPSPNSTIITSNGSYDGFLLKLSRLNNLSSVNQVICNGESIVSPSGAYTWTMDGAYLDTIPNSIGGDSIITTYLVSATVDTSVIQNGHILTANSNFGIYQWIDCNGNTLITNATSQTFEAVVDGSYAVIVSEEGCVDTSGCYQVTGLASEDHGLARTTRIYPNPAYNKLNIDPGKLYTNGTLELLNASGLKINEFKISDQQLIQLDTQHLSGGKYFVRIITEEEVAVWPIVKI